jgi:hypothetical protein
VEEIGDPTVDAGKILNLSRRFEPLDDSLSPWCRRTRIFRPVVQPLVLSTLDPQTRALARGALGLELVGDHDARRSSRLLETPAAWRTVTTSDLSAKKLNLRFQLLPVQTEAEKDGGQDAGLRAGEISGEYGSSFGKILSSAIAVDGLDAASRAA